MIIWIDNDVSVRDVWKPFLTTHSHLRRVSGFTRLEHSFAPVATAARANGRLRLSHRQFRVDRAVDRSWRQSVGRSVSRSVGRSCGWSVGRPRLFRSVEHNLHAWYVH